MTLLANQGSDEPCRGLIRERDDGGDVVDARGLDEWGGHSIPRGHGIRERLSPPDRAQLDPTPTPGGHK